MRKAIPKSIRKIVYKKYNGHCAYCGCKIPERDSMSIALYCELLEVHRGFYRYRCA